MLSDTGGVVAGEGGGGGEGGGVEVEGGDHGNLIHSECVHTFATSHVIVM